MSIQSHYAMILAGLLVVALCGCTTLPQAQPTAHPTQTPLPTATQTPLPTDIRTPRPALTNDALPTPRIAGIAREQREVRFTSQGVELVGELDLPIGTGPAPLAFIIHHSGPVTRDAYGYLAELLLERGYAVFRFDKRGTGYSSGEYGCCEAEDALAAYTAAVQQAEIDPCNVFIVAQSLGTEHLVAHYNDYTAIRPPGGIALLSNLLRADRIGVLAAPVLIIVSDSEPELQAIGQEAAEAHSVAQPSFGAQLYIAEGSEHSLFDIRSGPIDWRDPIWVERYHRGAMNSLLDWLDAQRIAPIACLRA